MKQESVITPRNILGVVTNQVPGPPHECHNYRLYMPLVGVIYGNRHKLGDHSSHMPSFPFARMNLAFTYLELTYNS
jgi:hypothetical protein